MNENGNREQQITTDAPPLNLAEVLTHLTYTQKRFVIARQETTTAKEAAEKIGVRPHLVYEWKSRGFPIDEALRLMAEDGVVMALNLRRSALAKAMAVKTEALDSGDEGVKQRAATEIIEWELGKAPGKVETVLSGEVDIARHSFEEDIAIAKEIIALHESGDYEADQ